jgi:hypothetical protein
MIWFEKVDTHYTQIFKLKHYIDKWITEILSQLTKCFFSNIWEIMTGC